MQILINETIKELILAETVIHLDPRTNKQYTVKIIGLDQNPLDTSVTNVVITYPDEDKTDEVARVKDLRIARRYF